MQINTLEETLRSEREDAGLYRKLLLQQIGILRQTKEITPEMMEKIKNSTVSRSRGLMSLEAKVRQRYWQDKNKQNEEREALDDSSR